MYFRNALNGSAVSAALSLVLTLLAGCGGSAVATIATPGFAVADTGNNRILLYDTSIDKTENAVVVLGQTGFTHASANLRKEKPAANTLNGPTGVARDSAGNLYVADSGNARVLIFRPPFSTGMNASVVIGQSGFTSNTPLVGSEATASGMGSAYSVAIDGSGNLWVADVSNARVLEYAPPFSNGMSATLAIGQSSTGSATVCYQTTPTANTLCSPYGMTFDTAGNLWVSDSDSNRVLKYAQPFSTGMAASLELGQPASTAFTSNSSAGPTASSLYTPTGLAFDPNGNLWLSDLNNNRVLEFVPPFSNGMAAASVLGQADFTHGDANQGGNNPTAGALSGPWGLAFDSKGNLSIADVGNSRVLIFEPSFSNGMNASRVIGQTSYALGSVNQGAGSDSPTKDSFFRPFGQVTF